MTPAQAMQLIGTQCSRQSLHQRIGCWRSKLAPPQLLQLQAIEAEWTASPAISSSESSHSTATNKEQITPLSSSRSGGRGEKRDIATNISTINVESYIRDALLAGRG
jgi:hypothetical protein